MELNDIVENHLGNRDNVGIYQRVFGAQAETACRNDHRQDVRGVFAWAFDGPAAATSPHTPRPAPATTPDSSMEGTDPFIIGSLPGTSNTGSSAVTSTTEPTATPTPTPTNKTPPPTWIFARDVPEEHQSDLREEMEYSRAYFSDRFGVEATGFTVLVGTSHESLAPIYRHVVGHDLSNDYHPEEILPSAWVTRSAMGGGVVTLMYGYQTNERWLSTIKHDIVHEYFHILQGQLATGFAQLQDEEIAWHNDKSAQGGSWLVEGLASYADYAYSQDRVGRRGFLGGRYTPYEDLKWYELEGSVSLTGLGELGDYRNFRCVFPEFYAYALSFVASVFLLDHLDHAEEESYVNYWRLVGERPTWQQAFEEAFGIGLNDFYEAFNKWLPSQLPSLVQLKLQVRWPDMESGPQTWRFLYAHPYPEGPSPESFSSGWTGLWGLPLYMTVTYPECYVWAAYLPLWGSDDQCTEYLLGWYKDGELTDRREDATLVQFIGNSSETTWNIPGHPDTLPHLGERKLPHCQ